MRKPRLLTPLIYLEINHEVKTWYDLIYPLIFCTVSTSLYLLIEIFLPKVKIFDAGGLISSATSLFGILVGFYIAALAAIATFSKADMDKPMSGVPPTLKIPEAKIPLKLSRRLFLSLLFGYLTFLSMLLYIIGSTSLALYPITLPRWVRIDYKILNLLYVAPYSFITGAIASNTLLGIHYLAYRIHIPNIEVKKISSDENFSEDE